MTDWELCIGKIYRLCVGKWGTFTLTSVDKDSTLMKYYSKDFNANLCVSA